MNDPIAAAVALSAETLRVSLADSVLSVLALLPKTVLALLLVVVGALLAKLAAGGIEFIITGLGLDTLSERSGFAKALRFFGDTLTLSRVAGGLTRVTLLIAFILTALRVLGFDSAIEFASAALAYLPRTAVALVAVLSGFSAAEAAVWLVRRTVVFFKIPVANPATIALIVRAGFISLGAFAALRALGVPDASINVVFIAAVAAAALAFGLGGKEKAATFISRDSLKK